MKRINIFCVGGGSGGHITPIFPVLHELAQLSELNIDLVVDKGFYQQAKGLVDKSDLAIKLHTISSGRLRRYAHFRWYHYLRYPSIPVNNVIDVFKVGAGYVQSLALLRRKPDVVFAKGGFVSLPFGLAAKQLGIPIVIHDSDARPGLTNRMLSRYAERIGTGTPVENYPYNQAITSYTGVPISREYRVYTPKEREALKSELGFDPNRPLIAVTGGGLGAQNINLAMLKGASDLLAQGIQVYHISGKAHFAGIAQAKPSSDDYRVVDFVYSGMVKILAAADIVVSRASATTIQELAGLAKPTILVPARQLGDQKENSKTYQASGSAIVLQDDDIEETNQLTDTIIDLIRDSEKAKSLANNLHEYAKPDAARDIARLIMEVVK